MIEYKIVEKKDSDLETVIEKSNLSVKFTLQEVKDHLEFTNKTLRQTKAQLEAEDIQSTMAEEALPLLKEIPEDKWNLVLMHANRKVQRPVSVSLVETAEATIKSYTEQVETIKEKLGLSIDTVETPVETVTEEVVD